MQGKLDDRGSGWRVDRSDLESWPRSRYRGDMRVNKSKKKTKKRNTKCLVTKSPIFAICHVAPPGLLDGNGTGYLWPSILDVWKLLGFFYGENKVREWKGILSRDPHSCANLMSLDPSSHVI